MIFLLFLYFVNFDFILKLRFHKVRSFNYKLKILAKKRPLLKKLELGYNLFSVKNRHKKKRTIYVYNKLIFKLQISIFKQSYEK